MTYTLKPWQRLLALLKQISFRDMPDDLSREILGLSNVLSSKDAWAAEDQEQILDLVERIEKATGASSFFEGIIIDGPVYGAPPEVPTGEAGWSSTPPPPV